MPAGADAILPCFACQVRLDAQVRAPVLGLHAFVRIPIAVTAAVRDIQRQACFYAPKGSVEATVSHLAPLPYVAHRIMLVEQLGENALGPIQYVDDILAPCPSIGAVEAVEGSIGAAGAVEGVPQPKQLQGPPNGCLRRFGAR